VVEKTTAQNDKCGTNNAINVNEGKYGSPISVLVVSLNKRNMEKLSMT
jgi:RNA binding exosome subunit